MPVLPLPRAAGKGPGEKRLVFMESCTEAKKSAWVKKKTFSQLLGLHLVFTDAPLIPPWGWAELGGGFRFSAGGRMSPRRPPSAGTAAGPCSPVPRAAAVAPLCPPSLSASHSPCRGDHASCFHSTKAPAFGPRDRHGLLPLCFPKHRLHPARGRLR